MGLKHILDGDLKNISLKNSPDFLQIIENLITQVPNSLDNSTNSGLTATPKIDFSKVVDIYHQDTDKLPDLPVLDLQGNRIESLGVQQKLAIETLKKQYYLISIVLGLNLIEDRYEFVIEPLPRKANRSLRACHVLETYSEVGRISLSKFYFDAACKRLDISNSINLDIDPYKQIIDLIWDLAHELYHKRQSKFFPLFFTNHALKKGVHSWDNVDYDLYKNQIFEVGAEAFAKKWIEFLRDTIFVNDNSTFSNSLRDYRSIEETESELVRKMKELLPGITN